MPATDADADGRREPSDQDLRGRACAEPPRRGAAPLVLVFEDLHWVDATTEDYLKTVLDSVASVPILMVLTHRIGYTPPFGGRSFVTNLTLRNLNPAESSRSRNGCSGSRNVQSRSGRRWLDKAEGVRSLSRR